MWSTVFKTIDVIAAIDLSWGWLVANITNPLGWVAAIVLLLGVLILLMWAAKKIIDLYLGLLASLSKLELRFFLSETTKAVLRRRRNFCSALQGDLVILSKIENWNDQFFTDLDAEVEAEGKFFASALDRLRRQPSNGLRRVPSLMRAITTSSEQFLLLVGEPGSGKSVALRHLAAELVRSTSMSKKMTAAVPLYINLKELPPPESGGFTAEYIKGFVLDNMRRGDADTTDYARENWGKYRDLGQWFFLFDSFDEIPEIMHAPSGSPLIRKYSEAIRLFLSSMGDCRGVVASREFKGPDALPWPTLRILPLSPKRQDLLLSNTFLGKSERRLTRQHLARAATSLHQNPLFLALLCRYVERHKKIPKNDHDLLVNHIAALAGRDEEYIWRKYAATPVALLACAKQIAVLLAEDPELGLAPKVDDLVGRLILAGQSKKMSENLLSALVDVKIGRTDIRGARQGDRRFTFSHRRYQETLFVEHLTQSPTHIPAKTLLLDASLREYAVTFLQSQPIEAINHVLDCATQIFLELRDTPVSVLPEFGDFHYFHWNEDLVSRLCRILQDGMAARHDDVPEALRSAMAAVLRNRWTRGDYLDQQMVLEVGGLLPESDLVEMIQHAIESGKPTVKRAAFRKIASLKDAPRSLRRWVAERVSEQTLGAISEVDSLRVEAFVYSLPKIFGAETAYKRARFLRVVAYPYSRLQRTIDAIFEKMAVKIWRGKKASTSDQLRIYDKLEVLSVSVILEGAVGMFLGSSYSKYSELLMPGSAFVLWGSVILFLSVFRGSTERLPDLSSLILDVQHASQGFKEKIFFFFLVIVFVSGSLAPAGIVHFLYWSGLISGNFDYVWYPITFVFSVILVPATSLIYEKRRVLNNTNRLVALRVSKNQYPLPLMAESFAQLRDWADFEPEVVFKSQEWTRSLLRFIFAVESKQPIALDCPLAGASGRSRVASYILERLSVSLR